MQIPGEIVTSDTLKIGPAIDLVAGVSSGVIEYVEIVQVQVQDSFEIVILDVSVERPQLCVHEIEPVERIAIAFNKSLDVAPDVLSLRSDFPTVPHLNLRPIGNPRSLCLYAEPFRDLKRSWTPARMIARIREWLTLTARGELHQDDQPLEPILLDSSGTVILPNSILENDLPSTPVHLALMGMNGKKMILVAKMNWEEENDTRVPLLTTVHRCKPQVHGVINNRPQNMAELSDLLAPVGVNILEEVCTHLSRWRNDKIDILSARLGMIILFPRTRSEGGPVESTDKSIFLADRPIKNLGIELGIWAEHEGNICPLIQDKHVYDGSKIQLDIMNPCWKLTRESAAAYSGHDISDIKYCAVGTGALGSQIVMNLIRSGHGSWTLVDDDHLMPHNLVRHALTSNFTGFLKAEALAIIANTITDPPANNTFLPANVLEPGEHQESLTDALQKADVILDMSASVTVARYLSRDIDSTSRRASVFVSPTGADLVVLTEDEKRKYKLDQLEMQYYRATATDEALIGHLNSNSNHCRYGQSCRDISAVLSPDCFGLHGAVASSHIRQLSNDPGPQIQIWKSNVKGEITRHEVEVHQPVSHEIGEWTVETDEGLWDKLFGLRQQGLPNETGGVLIGSLDLQRRVVYIVDTIPSPADSVEWPTLYIRGTQGLEPEVRRYQEATGGMLEYIGEWHSHPDHCSTAPSQDDLQVFSWLTAQMNVEGLPAVMMIVGECQRASCYLEQIAPTENLIRGGA